MKRNFLLIMMLITASISIHSQSKILFKYGLCSSSYWGENSSGTSSKSGYMVGIGMDSPIGNSAFSVAPMIELISKGANLGTGSSYTLNAVYIEVPLDFIYHLKINKDNSISFAAGPYMAYGIGGNDGNTFGTGPYTYGMGWGNNTTYKAGLERMDAGINFGLGYEYKMLLLNAGYDLGLKNVASNWPKNFAFILSMGIKI
jgi:hypothetical protein